MFEWWVVKCGYKNIDQQDMCLEETKLHAQNMLTNLGSNVNIIGGGGVHMVILYL
jgi:hypothetical protein